MTAKLAIDVGHFSSRSHHTRCKSRSSLLPLLILLGLVTSGVVAPAWAGEPEVVTVRSDGLELHGLLWYPSSAQRAPAILFNHGRGCIPQPQCDDREQVIRRLGPLFSERGYVFLALFRRGEDLSAGAGRSAGDLLHQEETAHGAEAANAMHVRLLQTEQLDDALAGLAYLRSSTRVDPNRMAVVGHSFGGSLSLLLAQRVPNLRAVVAFAAAALNWERSAALRELLTDTARKVRVPVLLVYASNDYSTQPGKRLVETIVRAGGSCDLSILPANGTNAEQGHDLIYSGSKSWGPVVFDFLAKSLAARR